VGVPISQVLARHVPFSPVPSQALPQTPQSVELLVVSWHPSVLPQSVWPVGHAQTPLWQVVPGSALVVQSLLLLQVIGVVHVLFTQVSPLAQAKLAPQPPQLLTSVVVSVHPIHVVAVHPAWAPQSVWPVVLHAQVPLWQVVPVSVQPLLVVQVTAAVHVLATQVWPVAQAKLEPHPPQLLGSVVVSVHPVGGPQSVCEELVHAQVPLWQVVPVSVQSALLVHVVAGVDVDVGVGVGVGVAGGVTVGPVALPVKLTICGLLAASSVSNRKPGSLPAPV